MSEMSGAAARLRGLVAAVAAYGAKGQPPEVARRIAIITFTAIAGGLVSFVHAGFYASYDAGTLAPAIAVNCAVGIAMLLVPLLHRVHHALAGAALIALICGSLFALVALLGTDTGLHIYLAGVAVAGPLFFGTARRWPLVAAAALPAALLVAAHFHFPPAKALIPLPPAIADGTFALSVAMETLILTVVVVYAFELLSRAEATAEREYQRSERLLLNILPAPIAARLKASEDEVIADDLPEITVLFADIVGFTPRAARLEANAVVTLLNRVFVAFDALADKYGLEKIKTIGDAYMAASGLPEPRADHAAAVANMALDLIDTAAAISAEIGETVAVRVGIHSGPAVAGVIGKRKFSYDVWGDTVNMAARMESHGVAGRIQVSAETHALLEDRFEFEPRGQVAIKGKGRVPTYFLTGRKKADAA